MQSRQDGDHNAPLQVVTECLLKSRLLWIVALTSSDELLGLKWNDVQTLQHSVFNESG